MTPADKQAIGEYMGWCDAPGSQWCSDCALYGCQLERRVVKYDLNDAGLCVKEMVRRGDWDDFVLEADSHIRADYVTRPDLVAWLYDAENLFNAMTEWLRGRG